MSLPDRITLETSDQELGVMLYQHRQAGTALTLGDHHSSTWKVTRWSHACLDGDRWTIELARLEPL